MIITDKILVIAPHPDDEILGCGGTLIKAVEKGSKVFVSYLTSGDSNQKVREKEAIKVCKYLKFKYPIFLKMQKKGLNSSLDNINALIKVFKNIKPNLIFINHDQDGDNDHIIAHKLTMEAIWRYNSLVNMGNKVNGVILYEIHKPIQSYNLVEDITNQIHQKMEAMAIYKSQLENSRIDLAIQGLNGYRGNMHEFVDYAEVFQIKRLSSLF